MPARIPRSSRHGGGSEAGGSGAQTAGAARKFQWKTAPNSTGKRPRHLPFSRFSRFSRFSCRVEAAGRAGRGTRYPGVGYRECGRSSGSGGSGGFSSLRDSGIPSVELCSRKVFPGETEGALELPNHSRTSAKWDEIRSQKNPQVIPNPSPGRSHSLGMDLSGKTGVGSVAWWGLEEGRSCGIHPIPGGIIPGFRLQQEIPGVRIRPGRFGNSWEKAGAGRGSSREAAGAGAVDLPSGRGFPVGIPPALPASRCSASSQGIFGNVRVRSSLPVPPRPPGFWDGSDSSLLIQEHSVSRKNSSGLSWDSWKNPGTKQSLAKAGR